MNKIVATVSCLVAMAACAFAGEYPDISIKELKTAIADKKVVVIDVNGSKSFAKGHIPSAVDFTANSKDLAKVLPKDKKALVVAYCGGPSCSAYKQAATAAEKLGYTNVKHLSAGISGWMQAGEATEKMKTKAKDAAKS
ncbi:MAG: rhodanese-related sulfurtransferase [Verrucomicrobiales bacterium]|jgi:rhodanese-related sulfurtransferase